MAVWVPARPTRLPGPAASAKEYSYGAGPSERRRRRRFERRVCVYCCRILRLYRTFEDAPCIWILLADLNSQVSSGCNFSASARTRWPRWPTCEGHRSAACDALYPQRPAIWARSGPGFQPHYWILAGMARGGRLSAISTTTSTATPSRQDARIDRYDPVLPLPVPK